MSLTGGPTINVDYESAALDPKGLPPTNTFQEEKDALGTVLSLHGGNNDLVDVKPVEGEECEPTEEELKTLRLVPAAMPWAAVAMCLIEFAERASYYGCSGVFSNFIRGPLPKGGNGAGAVAPGPAGYNQSSGALGMGVQAATALTTLFTFLAYTIPILGGIVADTKWGRFKTICVGTAVGAVAHVLLVIPALPTVIAGGHALAPFIIAMLILAFAAGFIKPSLGPLLCDQSPVHKAVVKTLKSGERVILDPQTTVQRYLLIFYWAINVGAFFSLATTYAEHDVGFWLAYLLPGIVYVLMPIVLVMVYKRLYKAPPQGSVVLECMRVFKTCLGKGGWKNMFKGGDDFWNHAKPSYIEQTEGRVDLKKIFWDDKFVDEIRQSLSACKVFLLIPIFNLADGGFGSTENAMSAAMVTAGVPNDLISNFNPLTIVIVAPILNFAFYPLLRRLGINMTPMWRMSTGFILAGINMIIGAILQWKVYESSPCGYYATSDCQIGEGISTISLWAQVPLYSLPAIGELFVNVTSYEIAYTRAPARMKGLVYAMVLFTSALSSALVEIVNPALVDPYLIWPYVAVAVACFLGAAAFPTFFKHLDVPVVFNDIDRMEGRQQPLAKIQQADSNGEPNEKA